VAQPLELVVQRLFRRLSIPPGPERVLEGERLAAGVSRLVGAAVFVRVRCFPLLFLLGGHAVPAPDVLVPMLQQRLGHDLQPALFAEACQHLSEDLGLYVREYVREGLQGSIEFAQVGLVEAMVARRSRRARRLLGGRGRASDIRRPDQRREDGRHGGCVSTLAWQRIRAKSRLCGEVAVTCKSLTQWEVVKPSK
jgi:hypothetical protein